MHVQADIRLQKLTVQQKMVYNFIEDAAQQGIRIKPLVRRTNLPRQHVMAAIQLLTLEKYIKAFDDVDV